MVMVEETMFLMLEAAMESHLMNDISLMNGILARIGETRSNGVSVLKVRS